MTAMAEQVHTEATSRDRLGVYYSMHEVGGGDGAMTSLYLTWMEAGQRKSGYIALLPDTARSLAVELIGSAAMAELLAKRKRIAEMLDAGITTAVQ